ncbi:hypothetical protein HDU92_006422 [Lobulomyces angularis]|nr:hypothetical protein HDU92_006422 [Lobulomyces angularis]
MSIIEKIKQGINDAAQTVINSTGSTDNFFDRQTKITEFPERVNYHGPYLKYSGNGLIEHWEGSILIVTESSVPPILTVNLIGNTEFFLHVKGFHLDHSSPTLKDVHFWRFDLKLPYGKGNETIQYSYYINGEVEKTFIFHVAGKEDKYWNWAFYSCNGLSQDVTPEDKLKIGGVTPLWKDLMEKHAANPFHVIVGGGDQVYADPFWFELQSIQEWLAIKGKQNKHDHPWSDQLEKEVSFFFLNLYTQSWAEMFIRDAFATIPQVNMLDDHDIWDGFGTYPEFLNQSNVFQGCKRIAVELYLLFQNHTTYDLACTKDEYFGHQNKSYSCVRQFGREITLIAVDARNERSLDQILSPESYTLLEKKVEELTPATTKHLVVVTGVPIIHPRLDFAEKVNKSFGTIKVSTNKFANSVKASIPFLGGAIDGLKKSLGKTGLFKNLINQFGLPELADDLQDHWTHEAHNVERLQFVEIFQRFSERRRIRVTLVAGDVHLALFGRFFNADDPTSLDHRLMYQVTSSAIANIPPPGPVVTSVSSNGTSVHHLNLHTKEEMVKVFEKDVNGNDLNDCCIGRRNYAIVNHQGEDLTFTTLVEPADKDKPCVPYTLIIPPLA